MLKRKNILLGVAGSIAAYKSADIARRLMEEGADVNVVMTEAACRFIPPYTLEAITGKPVHIDLFKDTFSHINLAKESDLFLIAPATANTINKLSCGIADDLLSTVKLSYEGPVLIAPAMNCRMYRNPLVQKHIRELKKLGADFIGPASGNLACGEEGEGRLVDVPEIIEAAVSAMTPKDLPGRRILVTAGPTREAIDPVRFISNRSSGKMGFAVARAALRRGASVTLISGPSAETPPDGALFVPVESASEMETAVLKHLPKSTSVVMSAAVSDFRPSGKHKVKLKKDDIKSMKLIRNNDIIKKIGSKKGRRILIGFAAESTKNIENAVQKIKKKNLDFIVLNNISEKGAGFDVDTNIITIIDKKGNMRDYPKMKKIEVANVILDRMLEV